MTDLLPTDLAFSSLPRISAGLFARILTRNASPAAPDALVLATIPERYDLDRAIALAFFRHESAYGTAGVAARSLNWGNLRSGVRAYTREGGFAYYHDWAASLQDWCQLIKVRYVGRGLLTVREALPVYAPSSDGNAPHRYADQVIADVARWMAEDTLPAFQGARAYRVKAAVTSYATIRAAARPNGPVRGRLLAGDGWRGIEVTGLTATVPGFGSSATWVKDDQGRFVWRNLLDAVPA